MASFFLEEKTENFQESYKFKYSLNMSTNVQRREREREKENELQAMNKPSAMLKTATDECQP